MDPGGGTNPLETMMAGLMNGNLFAMPFVNTVIFPTPRKLQKEHSQFTGATRDGSIATGDEGVEVGYRLLLPDGAKDADRVALHFHGNAEVCGEADDLAKVFHGCGFALMSVDYRGYGWSTGDASVLKLCDDAEKVLDAVAGGKIPGIAEGCRVVAWGRSIGALSAVHLAAYRPAVVRGVVSDAGLMSIASLPMVRQVAGQFLGPSAGETLAKLPDPAGGRLGKTTLAKCRNVECPAFVVHGDMDEIVPFNQGLKCFEALASPGKALERCNGAGHNDVLIKNMAGWTRGMTELLGRAAAYEPVCPAHCRVETHGLSSAAFNGKKGIVAGPAKVKEGDPPRARVAFEDPAMGEKAIKLANLKVLEAEPFLAESQYVFVPPGVPDEVPP